MTGYSTATAGAYDPQWHSSDYAIERIADEIREDDMQLANVIADDLEASRLDLQMTLMQARGQRVGPYLARDFQRAVEAAVRRAAEKRVG